MPVVPMNHTVKSEYIFEISNWEVKQTDGDEFYVGLKDKSYSSTYFGYLLKRGKFRTKSLSQKEYEISKEAVTGPTTAERDYYFETKEEAIESLKQFIKKFNQTIFKKEDLKFF
ncbi:MAG: hypothetical protein EKK64_05500 [Neisseriaceae bacterium]|nr:MAG: hypothetical protein EKK64_05500 [Neisseriaceae bacterium]